jgi:hypothetical protein
MKLTGARQIIARSIFCCLIRGATLAQVYTVSKYQFFVCQSGGIVVYAPIMGKRKSAYQLMHKRWSFVLGN